MSSLEKGALVRRWLSPVCSDLTTPITHDISGHCHVSGHCGQEKFLPASGREASCLHKGRHKFGFLQRHWKLEEPFKTQEVVGGDMI